MPENLPEKRLITGLGNPGRKYQNTRHNLGFMVVGHLAEKWQVKFRACSFVNGVTAEHEIFGKKVTLLMPATYMNASGVAVKQMIGREHYGLDGTLTVCDDLNLEFGRLKLRPAGTDGGNNGLKSIIQMTGSEEFPRLRMGINHPGHKGVVTDYVLEEFTSEEKKDLEPFVERAALCCEAWLQDGITKAMEQFNRR